MSIESISMVRFKLNDKTQNMENISGDNESPASNRNKNGTTTATALGAAHNLRSSTIREVTSSRLQISATTTTVNSITTPATYNSNNNRLINSNCGQNLITPLQAPKGLPTATTTVAAVSTIPSVLTTTTNIQYLNPPSNSHNLPLHSVIQAANPASVIQTASGITGLNHNANTNVAVGLSGALASNNTTSTVTRTQKANILCINKPNTTVIHTTVGANAIQIKPEPNIQQIDTNSEDSFTDDDSPRDRRELTRRPSYNKIYSEISGPDITDNIIVEDQTRKREIRLQKNREAARECRRKKKEYIKCLENRVAVLENQNKALIEELKSLKELYCQTKND